MVIQSIYIKSPSVTYVMTGDDKALLEREISVIEELLELEPNSKCTNLIIVSLIGLIYLALTGCLESLVYYKRLLVGKHLSDPQSNERRKVLLTSCVEMLEKLKEVDPQRIKRYADIGKTPEVYVFYFPEVMARCRTFHPALRG